MTAIQSFKIHAVVDGYLDNLTIDPFSIEAQPVAITEGQHDYAALEEKYNALLALYQSTIDAMPPHEKDNQLLIRFDTLQEELEKARESIFKVQDLLAIANEAQTADVFQVLRIFLAKANSNLQELVKVNQEAFNKKVKSKLNSNLALSKSFKKIDCIRVFRALFDAGKITSRDGAKLTLKDYFKTIGDLLDIDLSDASTVFSASLADSNSATKHTAIFDQLAKVIQNQYDSK